MKGFVQKRSSDTDLIVLMKIFPVPYVFSGDDEFEVRTFPHRAQRSVK